ncbi:MAG: hypothetical protein JO244_15345 [Solirubrobacterales bacterium]|nr:hypothetical protein [Solirubrobacterales bacterium]
MPNRLLRGQATADWLMLVGAVALFVSLFLTWSHQLTPAVLSALVGSPAIRGVPANPTGWQVYSAADVLLALLAAGLLGLALRGRSRWARVTALVAVGLALAFTAHAASVAPTDGLTLVDPRNPPAYLPHTATSGSGETLALVGLGLAAAGLLISLGFDLSSKGVRSSR